MKTFAEKIISEYKNKTGKKTIETLNFIKEIELQMGMELFELKGGYNRFYSIVETMEHEKILTAVKASGMNGRNPPLYNKYRVIDREEKKVGSNSTIANEILTFHPRLKKDYYLKNIKQYEKDRAYIAKISDFMYHLAKSHALDYRCTLNERSFEVFNDEKLLAGRGEAILKRLGLNYDDLNCYRTYEAFFYYNICKADVNNVLIIENKDTFLSLLKTCNSEGADYCSRGGIHLLVYGEGNKIQNSFRFMEELGQSMKVGTVYYFGDLDYPGIDIFLRLRDNYSNYRIVPHTGLYRQLLDSVRTYPEARNSKTAKIEEFLKYFSNTDADRMDRLLKEGKYIPQEGINFAKGKFEL